MTRSHFIKAAGILLLIGCTTNENDMGFAYEATYGKCGPLMYWQPDVFVAQPPTPKPFSQINKPQTNVKYCSSAETVNVVTSDDCYRTVLTTLSPKRNTQKNNDYDDEVNDWLRHVKEGQVYSVFATDMRAEPNANPPLWGRYSNRVYFGIQNTETGPIAKISLIQQMTVDTSNIPKNVYVNDVCVEMKNWTAHAANWSSTNPNAPTMGEPGVAIWRRSIPILEAKQCLQSRDTWHVY